MATVDIIEEVLSQLSLMVATDGGSMRIAEFSEDESKLVVDYSKGVNEACATCVIDSESLQAFIEEGVRSRGVSIDEVRIVENTPATSAT